MHIKEFTQVKSLISVKHVIKLSYNCVSMSTSCMKVLSQVLHWWGLLPVWTLLWNNRILNSRKKIQFVFFNSFLLLEICMSESIISNHTKSPECHNSSSYQSLLVRYWENFPNSLGRKFSHNEINGKIFFPYLGENFPKNRNT